MRSSSAFSNSVQRLLKALLTFELILICAIGNAGAVVDDDETLSLFVQGSPVSNYAKRAETVLEVYDVLLAHLVGADQAPENFSEELFALSEYYSQFPSVVELIRSLAHLSWDLRIKEGTFNTLVEGRALTVERVEVQFDMTLAVQLKFYRACSHKLSFCVASPADALLHELLHAKSVLFNPEQFIADGGMSGIMYPFEHERKILLAENKLYRALTKIDQRPRPIRNEHTGKSKSVGCITCIN